MDRALYEHALADQQFLRDNSFQGLGGEQSVSGPAASPAGHSRELMWGDQFATTITSTGAGLFTRQTPQLVYLEDVHRVYSVRLGLKLTSPLGAGELVQARFLVTAGCGKATFQVVQAPPVLTGPVTPSAVFPFFLESSLTVPDFPARMIQVTCELGFLATGAKTLQLAALAAAAPYNRGRDDR